VGDSLKLKGVSLQLRREEVNLVLFIQLHPETVAELMEKFTPDSGLFGRGSGQQAQAIRHLSSGGKNSQTVLMYKLEMGIADFKFFP
jgi:hypothetical protein